MQTHLKLNTGKITHFTFLFALYMSSLTYQNAGVNIDAGQQLVKNIAPLAQSTKIAGVLSNLGGFGALFELDLAEYKNPVLVSGTDGVGSKLKLATSHSEHQGIGIDLVAMCVNDLIVQGAKPLFFLDYYATGQLNIDQATAVISGIARACRQAACALVGGETAEVPKLYKGSNYDLAGFCVGIVDKAKLIDGRSVKLGDVVIGLASSGVHANGFSLVHKIIEKTADTTKIKALLTPTKIYVKSILALLEKVNIAGIAHITGGGLLENIPRVLPPNLGVVLDKGAWQVPEIFNWLQTSGNISHKEMYRVFNCGIGMVVIVDKNAVDTSLANLKKSGEDAFIVGKVSSDYTQSVMIC